MITSKQLASPEYFATIGVIYPNTLVELIETTAEAIKAVNEFRMALLHAYPNERIVWLAIHHRKERVRKKNTNRILKYF